MPLWRESHHETGWIVGKNDGVHPSLTCIAKGTYDIVHGGTARPAAKQLLLSGDIALGEDPASPLLYASDFAPFKPLADVLLVGRCHAPGKRSMPVVTVRLDVGGLSKSLAVIGDRVWKRGVIVKGATPPEPFQSMELSWGRSYGGHEFARNPAGRGHGEEQGPDGKPIIRMPNIEDPVNLIRDPRKGAEPAGFGPIPLVWPQRITKAGTYGTKWLKTRWPWLPEDFDWTFYNAAPADQQVSYLRGDERVRLENLHAEIPVLETRLPGLRVRCFHAEHARSPLPLREVPMKLDTLWIGAEAATMVLVWRGVVEIPFEKFPEKVDILFTAEPLADPPTPVSAYEDLLRARQAGQDVEEEGGDSPTGEPEAEQAPPPEEPDDEAVADAAAAKVEADAAEAVKSAPAPPEPPGPPPPPSGGVEEKLKELGIDLAEVEAPPPEEPEDAPPEPSPEPPSLTREWCLARAAETKSLEDLDLTDVDLSGASLEEVSFRGSVLSDADFRKARLRGAVFQGAVLPGADLTGADLKGADFTGADLTRARLARADLSGAVLEGADLSGASLRGADLTEARGKKAILERAMLSRATLVRADFSGADFTRAQLSHADFTEAKLVEATLERARANPVTFVRADMTKVHGAGVLILFGDFKGMRGPGAIFEQGRLERCDFSDAEIPGAEFEGSLLVGTRFDRADLRKARFPGAMLRDASLVRANLLRATMSGADLTRADLSQSNLFWADLFETTISETNFERANVKRTTLVL